MSTKNKTKNADVNYAKDGKSCVVIHRERFATILGSTGFATNSYVINPVQSATFPWLSGIANRFESYSFDSLQFEFRTKTATTALGDVILAVDYDATDAAPTDSIQAEAYDESASGAPWQNVTHVCKKLNLKKLPMNYVPGDTQPAATDLKMYDIGNLFVCTENQASTALAGYLYVSYSVRFFTPQLRSNDITIAGGVITGATAMTAANPFGTGASVDTSGRGITISTASRITFVNPGTYSVSVVMVGTVLSAVNRADGAGLTSASISGIANAASTTYVSVFTVVSTVANGYLDVTATATTVTTMLAYIGSSPYGSLAFTLDRLKRNLMYTDGSSEGCRARACSRLGINCQPQYVACPAGCYCESLRSRNVH